MNCCSSICPLYKLMYSTLTSVADLLCSGCGHYRGKSAWATINSDENLKWWKILDYGLPVVYYSGQSCMDRLVIITAAVSFSYILRFRKILIKWLKQAYGCFNLIHKVAANIQYAVSSRGERWRRSNETPLEKMPENWETCMEEVRQIGWSTLPTTSRSRYCTNDAHLPYCAPTSQFSLTFLWYNEKIILKPAWQQKNFHF